MNDIAFIKL